MRIPISAQARSRFLTMLALVCAGEMIYSLPFHLPRYYRPTMLEVFGVSYANLGDVMAPYGVLALLSYFPGGILADRFPARALMSLSLALTAAGGFYMMTLPGMVGLSLVYSFWGVTTILPFWCAMISATRDWGGQSQQGRGFGLLDGGRGLVAALFASAGVFVLRAGLGPDPFLADAATREAAFRAVILNYSLGTLAAAALVWWCIPNAPARQRESDAKGWQAIKILLRFRAVWLQAVVVVCAYCGYKWLDYYSAYAYDVLAMDEAAAAGFSAAAAYIRPGAALAAGLVGDRFGIARTIGAIFAAAVASWAVMAFLDASPGLLVIVYGNLLVSVFCIYAVRGLYFALLEQTHLPHAVTGTAVGLISLVGYTPDIFFNAIAGRILDATPGVGGYQQCFVLLALTAGAGLLAAAMLHRGSRRSPDRQPA